MPNIYLSRITNLHEPSDGDGYPFNIPAVKQLRTLEFESAVTYFIGENGSGKSTLLEAIAVKLGMNAEGGGQNFNFSTSETHSDLYKELRILKHYRWFDTFFYRAESFYNVISYLDSLTEDDEYGISGNPFFSYGGKNLHQFSHGEGMVRFFENRLEQGLYIFDEPEAALSYQNQLKFLLWMKDAVSAGSQLIISTHSPVLLAYPDAVIYHLNAAGYHQTTYEESYIYNDMRAFINNVPLIQKELGLLDIHPVERT